MIELDRTERRVFESRGIVHHAMGNFRHAVEDFTSAIDINPEAPDSYTLRGQVGSPLPHLHRDRACPCHICTGIGAHPTTSAPGPGLPLPHLHRNWHRPSHICAATGPTPATSAPRLQAHLSLSKFELGIEDFDKARPSAFR